MAAPSPPASFYVSKQEVINLLLQKGCKDANYVSTKLNSYSDILPLVFEFAKTFDSDPEYLVSLLSQFEDAVLVSLGIFLNKTLTSVVNPLLVVKSTIENITIDSGAYQYFPGLEIFYNSNIGTITVTNNTIVSQLTISSSEVGTLVAAVGSCVDMLTLKDAGTTHATINKIIKGSCVNATVVDPNSTIGGLFCQTITTT
jgi:hypothetical protein